MTADEIIRHFALEQHPEGGWYRQTWIAEAEAGARASGTAILYLLKAEERSHWHRIDATEIWHFHMGAPLELRMTATLAGPASCVRLGPAWRYADQPQAIVPPHHWQAARSLGDWTLVGCTVSPGFRFDGFELAPQDIEIPMQ